MYEKSKKNKKKDNKITSPDIKDIDEPLIKPNDTQISNDPDMI